ncbi:twin-arginine translocation signal domain-containing protein [Devosia sp. A8/3-2]|nr:twin-arginine translocation signal domain-containing protein [Devosia sp. A8/3-2]
MTNWSDDSGAFAPTRRDFLRTAGALTLGAAAGGLLLPASAMAQAATPKKAGI